MYMEADDGSAKIKYGVLAGIVVVFAAGVFFATSGGKAKADPKPSVAAATDAQAPVTAGGSTPAPPQDTLAAASAPAPAPTADVQEPLAAQPAAQVADADVPPVADDDAGSARLAEPAPDSALAMTESMDDLVPAGAAGSPESALYDEDGSADIEQAPTRPSEPARLLRSPPPPAAAVLSPWWRATGGGAFSVQYVGQAAEQQALVIRFSKGLAAPRDIDRHIELIAQDGTAVPGGWELGGNRFVAVRSGLAPGRYIVRIDKGLNSVTGDKLAVALSGPVYIQ